MFACCIFTFLYVHAEESAGGLLFTSSKEKVDKRTSLLLFSDKFQKFENTFTLSFDLSILNSSQFGHIFHIINDSKQEVEFVFVNFYGVDSMYLDFHSPITHKSVQVPITKEDIDKESILHFDINFDLKADKASITFNNKVYICQPVGLENPSRLQFAFGLYGLNLDVPQMLIKNLHIRQEKGKSFFFPLDESAGGFAYDKIEKNKALVKNPEWIVNKHYFWQYRGRFTIGDKAGISYDEMNNCIRISDNDSLYYLYLRYDNVTRSKNDSAFDLTDSHLESNLLHSNTFSSQEGDVYRFGGYINHSYSNKIYLHNKKNSEWEPVDFTGDTIMPRFYSASGDGAGQDEKLLFGGFGNETGKEEHGGRNLYDLYVLNLIHKTITNLWNIKEIPKTEFIPSSNLILSKDKKYFYALCYAHQIAKTVGYLYRFDMKTGAYEIMSDSIGFTSEDMSTSVNLFFNRQLNEFYAVIQDLSEQNENRIQIYSLLAPPISKMQLGNSLHPQKLYPRIFLSIIVFILLLAGAFALWYFIHRKGKRNSKDELMKILHSPDSNELDRKQKQSAVYLFGIFTVYDRSGKDISFRFSMKMRVLFSLVLLNTKGETGISTDNLASILWPDKDVNDSKNIRGVTINRLRRIIEDIDGISLVHQNHQWCFALDKPFYSDWVEYSGIVQTLHHTVNPEQYNSLIERIVAIVRNGVFLANVNNSGIDSYKSDEEERLERLLKEYIVRLYDDRQYRKIIQLAPAFFAIDPLNEDVLNICIKSYSKLGKKEDAKIFFENYKRTHKMLTGEEYKES